MSEDTEPAKPVEELPKPPTILKLLFETPLYQKIKLDSDRDEVWLERAKFHDLQYDAFCIECGRSSTFRTGRNVSGQTPKEFGVQLRDSMMRLRISKLVFAKEQFAVHAACQRVGHVQSFFFESDHDFIIKIGQYPSMEDVASSEIERFRKQMGTYYSELRKAGGLISHGIGIGAFVYLRRVFENLIETHRLEHEALHGPIPDYSRKSMAERVVALGSSLPAAVVENAVTYSILSKGIHELSEGECKLYFPVVRAAVLAMLEDDFDQRQKRKAAEDLRAEVAKISATLGKREGAEPAS